MTIIQLYKVKKVKPTKSKSASKKAKKPIAAKKAKGKSSKPTAKTSKQSKPVKKIVSKVVSKTSKSKSIQKASKPTKSAKVNITAKKKVKKSIASAAKASAASKPTVSAAKVKKVGKDIAPKKITKPVKPAKKIVNAPAPITKPAKAIKVIKPENPSQPIKPAQKDKKPEKISAKAKEKPEKIGFDEFDDQPVKKKGKGGRKPKSKNDDDEPEIAHDELIEQIIQTTKRQSKAPKKPRILQTFVNPMASLTVALPEGVKKAAVPKKEPKGKFELEYVVRTSAGILYELLTTPSGLSEWFADDVNIRDGIFTFFWDGSEQKARLIGFKEEKYVRLQWLDKPEGTYFEFRIERDELTGDISLMIVDFAEESSDQQTSKLLWDSQVNKLLNVLGSN